MKTIRLLLLLVAAAIVVLVATILRHESERTPENVLSQARWLVSLEEPNFSGALLTIEAGLRSLGDEHSPQELAPLALERMRIYRARWDRSSIDKRIAHEPGDLRMVLTEAQKFVERYGSSNSKALLLGTQAAIEMQRYGEAALLANMLMDSSPDKQVRAQAQRSLGIISVAQGDQKLEQLLASQSSLEPERFVELLRRAQRVALLNSPGLTKQTRPDRPSGAPDAALETGSKLDASVDYARAEQHYLKAIELYPDELSVLGLQELYLRSELFDDVIDVGNLALSRQALFHSTAILSLTLKALVATNRDGEARDLLKQRLKLNKKYPLDFQLLSGDELSDLCQIMLELGDQLALALSAGELQGRSAKHGDRRDFLQIGSFYTVLARAMSGNARSVSNIKPIVKRAEPRVDTYEGQLMEYWAAVAEVARLNENKPENVRLLLKAAEHAVLDPIQPRMRELTGQMWHNLAETLMRVGNLAGAEKPLAHALRLLPGRREELLSSFPKAGEASIVSRGRRLGLIQSRPSLRDDQGLYPSMGPYEACFRARRCLETNRASEVIPLLVPVLREYPGFPLALELLAETELGRGEPSAAIAHLLELEEHGLASPESKALLAGIPANLIEGQVLRRLLQAAPGESALLALLQRCARQGDQERMLEILFHSRPIELPASALLLGVELQLDREDVQSALTLYERLDASASRSAEAVGPGLRLVAALQSNPKSKARAAKLMRELLANQTWKPGGLERGIDALLSAGHIDLAREALDKADSSGLPLGPQLLLRWAWSGALAGNAPNDLEAIEALTRAEPYLASGKADLALLLMDQDAGDSEAVSNWARRLLNSELASNELQEALLQQLAGHGSRAQRIIEKRFGAQASGLEGLPARTSLAVKLMLAAQLDAPPDTTLMPWLSGADAVWYAGDLREPMAMLLAAGDPDFAAWVLARRGRLTPEQRATPFYATLRAMAWVQLGFRERADAELIAHTESATSEPEVWILREELARQALGKGELGQSGSAQRFLEALQQERLEKLGPLGDNAAEVALIRARELGSKGRADEAATFIQNIRTLWPLNPGLLLEAARLTKLSAGPQQAFELYSELFDSQGSKARAVLPEVMLLLEEQAASGQLSQAAHRARLASLEAIFPEQPALPLALAQMQLAQPDSNSSWNSERAMDHLNRFQRRTTRLALEDALPGSAEQWIRFLAGLDMPQATKLAAAELDANPEQVELWRLWLELMQRNGKLNDARRIHASIRQVFNDAALERSHGILLLDSGEPIPSDMRNTLKRMANSDPELALRLALGIVGKRSKGAAAVKARKEVLEHWTRRAELKLDGLETARLLLRSLGPEDAAMAGVLDEVLKESKAPRERSVLRALSLLLAMPVHSGA